MSWINPNLRPGEMRRVVTGIPGKTGVVYTLDRATGEFLWATPTITQNVISGIDGATGAVSENSEVVFSAEGQEVLTCPSYFGGKDWETGVYSPQTNTMYFPLRNVPARGCWPPPPRRAIYALATRNQITPGTDQVGTVQAISAETGATVWKYEQRSGHHVARSARAGGLLFGGDVNGRFRAFDQDTGEVLWEINLGSSVTGFPITYAVDGRQYVAVSTGSAELRVRVHAPHAGDPSQRRPTTCSCSRFRTERRPSKNQAPRPPSRQGALGCLHLNRPTSTTRRGQRRRSACGNGSPRAPAPARRAG